MTLRRTAECMGTVFSFDVRTPGVPEAALDDAVWWLHWVDETFSTFRPDSAVSRLARDELELADCPPEVGQVLADCARLSAATDGYFSACPGGRLDPSGYVKGWAIERASDLLAAAGSGAHCINGGGDVQCIGTPEPGRPWRVGITHPLRPGYLAAVVTGAHDACAGLAAATSGTAERGAHVLDPHTGRPPRGLVSITLVGSRLARTDALATAGFAMGPDARDWVEALDGYEAFAIRTDGTTWATSGWGRPAGAAA
jgi:thiamine biosynthesis lipoprotein